MARWSSSRRAFVATGIASAVALLVFAIVLYYPSSAGAKPVTVASIDWTLLGDSNGSFPFTERFINESGPTFGFPIQVAAHSSINLTLIVFVQVQSDVPLCSATTSPPLTVTAVTPTPPGDLQGGDDNAIFLTIYVGAAAGTTVIANGTLSALGCALP